MAGDYYTPKSKIIADLPDDYPVRHLPMATEDPEDMGRGKEGREADVPQIGTPAHEQWQLRQMVRATRLVLAGRILWWESAPYSVTLDLTRGCEAMIQWDCVPIAHLRRNPDTGTYHGLVYLGWFVDDIDRLGEVLKQEFGVPYSTESPCLVGQVEF